MRPTAMPSLYANVDVDVVTCRPHLQSVSHSTHTRQVPFVGTKEAERDLQSGARPGISAPVMRKEQPSILVLPTGHNMLSLVMICFHSSSCASAGGNMLPAALVEQSVSMRLLVIIETNCSTNTAALSQCHVHVVSVHNTACTTALRSACVPEPAVCLYCMQRPTHVTV